MFTYRFFGSIFIALFESLIELAVVLWIFTAIFNSSSSNETGKIMSIQNSKMKVEWTDKFKNEHIDQYDLSTLGDDWSKARVQDDVNLKVDYMGLIEKATVAMTGGTYDRNIKDVSVKGLDVYFFVKWFR